MGNVILPARFDGQSVPPSYQVEYNTGQTFLKGAPLTLSSGKVSELAASLETGTGAVYGFANEPAGSHPGQDMVFSSINTVGNVAATDLTRVSVARANRATVFSSPVVNGSATLVAVTVADRGASWGLSKQGTVWRVDKSLAGGVHIVDVDTDQNLVYFRVIEARLQLS